VSALDFAKRNGALLVPFGMAMPEATDTISDAASRLKVKPEHVWCAAGSGTLARGLQQAWPKASIHAIQVGGPVNLPGVTVHQFSRPYSWHAPDDWAPFDCCPTYEKKAYHIMRLWLACNRRVKGLTLFWSPMNGPAVN
jgi:hypothetical protein